MNTNRATAATLAVVAAATLLPVGIAAAAIYDYDGAFETCTSSCNAVVAWGAPGSSDNQAPSLIRGSFQIDVEPGSDFDTSALGEFELEVFNPAQPLEPYDGTNSTSANPMPLNAIMLGSGTTDASGAPASGELVLILTDTLFSNNDVRFYFDLSDGSAEGFLFTNVVRFLTIRGEFTLRPPPDADGDGVPDAEDNCLLAANPPQRDSNGDGFGNLCDADLNDDCATNGLDLGLFRQAFFGTDEDADLNGDGVVNPTDLGSVRALYFAPPGPSALASCP